MCPAVSAQTRLLTGLTQPSCAPAISAAVRAVSMGSRHSKPRLGRCVPVHLSASARPSSGCPCTTGPCLVAQTGTVTGGAAAHGYPLVPDLGLPPAVWRPVPGAVEPLQVQVLRVGVRVRDGPRDRPVEPEVREPGQAGERGPGDVELRAAHPALPVHVRRVECPVRVVADHRAAMGGVPPADRPRVGAWLDLGEEAEVSLDVGQRLVEQVRDAGREPSARRHGHRHARDRP